MSLIENILKLKDISISKFLGIKSTEAIDDIDDIVYKIEDNLKEIDYDLKSSIHDLAGDENYYNAVESLYNIERSNDENTDYIKELQKNIFSLVLQIEAYERVIGSLLNNKNVDPLDYCNISISEHEIKSIKRKDKIKKFAIKN